MKMLRALVIAASAIGSVAHGQVLWDEAVDGDASGNALVPSSAGAVSLGSNVFKGTVSNVAGGDQRDYITFVVPAGLAISELTLLSLTPNNIAWTHFDDGATSVVPSEGTADSLLAGAHILGPTPDGTDLFPNYQAGSSELLAGPGFNGLIGPGTYTFLMQQTSPVTQAYSLDFVVIPGPGVASIGAMGALCVARRRRG